MTQNGRVIPFNSLRLDFNPKHVTGRPPYGHDPGLTYKTELKLQHLHVYREGFGDGKDREWLQPLRALLELKSHELRSLKIDCSPLFDDLHPDNFDWNPRFPKLEILEIGGGWRYEFHRSDSRKDTTRWLLKNAPHLKKIVIDQGSCLRSVPVERLALV